MLIDERITIRTPEGIPLSLSVAGNIPRALAYTVDLIIRLVVFFVLILIVGLQNEASHGLLLLAAFCLEWFYPTLFEAFWHGQTPGKKLMGLVVLHADGSPLSFNGSVLRNLLRSADIFPFFYLFGFVSVLFTRKNQRLGDIAANTIVVHKESLADTKRHAHSDSIAPDWPLKHADQQTLLTFLERQTNLSTGRLEELAQLVYPELPKEEALKRLRSNSAYLAGSQS